MCTGTDKASSSDRYGYMVRGRGKDRVKDKDGDRDKSLTTQLQPLHNGGQCFLGYRTYQDFHMNMFSVTPRIVSNIHGGGQ